MYLTCVKEFKSKPSITGIEQINHSKTIVSRGRSEEGTRRTKKIGVSTEVTRRETTEEYCTSRPHRTPKTSEHTQRARIQWNKKNKFIKNPLATTE